MSMTTWALAAGAIARVPSNAEAESRIPNPRMCDPLRCLRFPGKKVGRCVAARNDRATAATIRVSGMFMRLPDAAGLSSIYPYISTIALRIVPV
jgi:hypothetical protein